MKYLIPVLVCVGIFVFFSGIQPATDNARAHGKIIHPNYHTIGHEGPSKKRRYIPKPLVQCTRSREGEMWLIKDEYLGAWVLYKCICDVDGCRWQRQAYYATDILSIFGHKHRKWVWDSHRACPSIVCYWHTHYHHWPVRHIPAS